MKKVLLALTLAAGLGACGGVETGVDEPSTLARLQGVISDPTGVNVGRELRLAVVWFRRTPPLDADAREAFKLFAATEDLPITASFPTNFALALRNPPPPEAIDETFFVPTGDNAGEVDADPEVRVSTVRNAAGVLVVYHDRNGNERLDLIDAEATEFVDDVVGVANRALLVWLEGPVPETMNVPKQAGAPVAGFNFAFGTQDILFGERTLTEVQYDEGEVDLGPREGARFSVGLASQLDALDWRPPTSLLSVELSDHAALDLAMCSTTLGTCLDLITPRLPPPTPLMPAPSPTPAPAPTASNEAR